MKMKTKKFSIEDVPTRVEWINTPTIHRNMFFELPATIDKTEKWCESIQSSSTRVDFSFLDDENQYLAMGGLTGIHPEHKSAEFYVMVNPELHGQGIGKKVSQWVYNYAFSKLKLHKIFLYTNDDNTKAYKIYENSGFVLEGTLREHKWKNGKFRNRRFYGLLRSEWEEQPWRKDIEDEI